MKSPAPAGDVDVELLKAVAQAWHAHSGNPRPSRAGGDDSDAGALPRAGAARHRPSRFKLEAMAAAAAAEAAAAPPRQTAAWDFAQSLWDSYELVAVARKLESGLNITDHAAAAAAAPAVPRGAGKRVRESGRRLRSLFLRSTSRRIDEPSS
ncbi:unnamed protein product [Urochloa humidicola]